MYISIKSIAIFLLSVYALACAYAYATKTVVNPSSITDDYICIKDSMPDSYVCMPKSKDPIHWYLKPVRTINP